MTPAQKIRQVATECFGAAVGCGDGGCIFGAPTGMHTNAGCRCAERHSCTQEELRTSLRRMALIARKLAEKST